MSWSSAYLCREGGGGGGTERGSMEIYIIEKVGRGRVRGRGEDYTIALSLWNPSK